LFQELTLPFPWQTISPICSIISVGQQLSSDRRELIPRSALYIQYRSADRKKEPLSMYAVIEPTHYALFCFSFSARRIPTLLFNFAIEVIVNQGGGLDFGLAGSDRTGRGRTGPFSLPQSKYSPRRVRACLSSPADFCSSIAFWIFSALSFDRGFLGGS